MTKKQKKTIAQIAAGIVLFVLALIVERCFLQEQGRLIRTAVYLVPYLAVAYDIILEAFEKIGHGQWLDEDFLMVVASVAAIAIGEYEEGVAVVIFFKVGELFEGYAVNKSRKSIADLMDICPEYANVESENGLEKMDPDDVEVGEIIVILPGEKIPLDGVVEDGNSMIDTSALTGESVPRSVKAGDEIISGCINGNGRLKVRVTKEFDDSTVSKILELVENASSKKAPVENFITKFARYYTPTVVGLAVVLAVLPPLLLRGGADVWGEWIHRACTFLVISCPCALVISVPMGFFGGIGAASSRGILVKGSNFIEAFDKVDTLVLDKTGTVTSGVFEVTGIYPSRESDELLESFAMEKEGSKLLALAAVVEESSSHPIARSIRNAWEGKCPAWEIGAYEELSGRGIRANVNNHTVLAGNEKLMESEKVDMNGAIPTEGEEWAQYLMSTVTFIAVDGKYAGRIQISDRLRENAAETMQLLRKNGIRRIVMLTGDRREVAEAVAGQLGLDDVYAELLPGDKVEKVEMLERELEGKSGKLAFVGDGINDAPVIARADVGIAMGGMGSDAAIEAADIVLMDDSPRKLCTAKHIAGKTLRIVRENIWFALGVKFLVLILGALGWANMWAAVFADVGVSVIAILNSMRCLKVNEA